MSANCLEWALRVTIKAGAVWDAEPVQASPFRRIDHLGRHDLRLLRQGLVKNNLGQRAFRGPLHRLRMDLPRVKAVTAAHGAVLDIEWRDGERSTVNLIGWITTGGSMLAPLRDPAIWATA